MLELLVQHTYTYIDTHTYVHETARDCMYHQNLKPRDNIYSSDLDRVC